MGITKSFGSSFVGGGRAASVTPAVQNLVATGKVLWGEKIVGDDRGLSLSPVVLEEVTTAWTTEDYADKEYETGIGVIQLYRPGNPLVLAINDIKESVQPLDFPVGAHLVVIISSPIQLPVAGTNPVEYITVYPVRF